MSRTVTVKSFTKLCLFFSDFPAHKEFAAPPATPQAIVPPQAAAKATFIADTEEARWLGPHMRDLRIQAAPLSGLSHGAHTNHESRRAQLALFALGQLPGTLKGPHHNVVELFIDLLFGPEE